MWLQVFKVLMFMWTRLATQKGTTLSWPWQGHLKVNPILDPSAVLIETRVTLESLWVLVQLLKSIRNKHFWIFAITLKTLYSFVVFREQLKEVSNGHWGLYGFLLFHRSLYSTKKSSGPRDIFLRTSHHAALTRRNVNMSPVNTFPDPDLL